MKNISLIILIISNTVPLIGVFTLNWDVASVISIYWVENIVVGFYNVLKMLKAEKAVTVKDKVSINGKPFVGDIGVFIVFFFIAHFGIFTMVHGVFVFSFFVKSGINLLAITYGFVALLISHGVSYYINYLGTEEYKKVSRADVMFLPYKRVVILHLVILFGGFAIQVLSFDILAVILLVLFKIIIDVSTHLREHKI